MMHPKEISILNFTYALPEDRIATFPLTERDDSKLLVYKEGAMQEDQYKNIASYLPDNSLLVFNNTKVIQARILFQKATGGMIEIFCLEPYEAVNEYSSIMSRKEKLQWKCMIGGASKWKEGLLSKKQMVQGTEVELQARLKEKLPDAYVVELSWQPADFTFAEVIDQAGDTPLPPYLKRKAAASDKERYQTVYAKYEGSVAAPTAGLHFTPGIFASLAAKNIAAEFITLHVGAGTFKPVKAAALEGHEMHAEWMDITVETIKELIKNAGNIIAVGTTSLRTLESLYWMGVKCVLNPNATIEELMIYQWDVYETPLSETNFSATVAMEGLLKWMANHNSDRLISATQILIAPGYQYRVVKAMVTNFHQPQSTLLLLVAAAIGDDWRKLYAYAMENDFRFLSYGDGSLLFLNQKKS